MGSTLGSPYFGKLPNISLAVSGLEFKGCGRESASVRPGLFHEDLGFRASYAVVDNGRFLCQRTNSELPP